MSANGKLIVIEGLDGSGKATQAELLFAYLGQHGLPVAKVSFPDYESDSSALVRMYLKGEFGNCPNDVNAYAASSFYAVDRYASYKKNWETFYQNGGVVIADRYTTSNAIHQCSKLPKEDWDEYLKWLFDYEYKLLGIPEPTLTIFLDVMPEISQKLMTARYAGDEGQKDIHEQDLDYQYRSHEAAVYCCNKFGWSTVACCDEGKMRPAYQIAREIISLLKLNCEDL